VALRNTARCLKVLLRRCFALKTAVRIASDVQNTSNPLAAESRTALFADVVVNTQMAAADAAVGSYW